MQIYVIPKYSILDNDKSTIYVNLKHPRREALGTWDNKANVEEMVSFWPGKALTEMCVFRLKFGNAGV